MYLTPPMRQPDRLLDPQHRRARTPRAASRFVLAICLASLPLGASTAQQTLYSATSPDAAASYEESAEIVPFAAQFTDVIEPLGPDLQDIDLMVPPDAVDLDTFEPPRGPTILRDLGRGVASYYGRRFHGRRTANGERFDMGAMTAAHKTLPFGSLVRVTNTRNGKSVTVRINDRGPFIRGRTIDLSRAAAREIGMISRGHASVEMELLAP